MIPALRNAEFVRYGVMHRNTYLNSRSCSTGIIVSGATRASASPGR